MKVAKLKQSHGGVTDPARVASLAHQRQHAAKRVEEMLKQLEDECAGIRAEVKRCGAVNILRTPGNIGAAAGRLEAACESMKTIREACEIAGVE